MSAGPPVCCWPPRRIAMVSITGVPVPDPAGDRLVPPACRGWTGWQTPLPPRPVRLMIESLPARTTINDAARAIAQRAGPRRWHGSRAQPGPRPDTRLCARAGRHGLSGGRGAPAPEQGTRRICRGPACPAAGHRGRGGRVSGAAPGGRPAWPGSTDGTSVSSGRQRWNIGAAGVLADPGLPGACGTDGVCGARLGRAGRGGEPGGAVIRPRSRAWRHPDPGEGGRHTHPTPDPRSGPGNGGAPARAITVSQRPG